MKLLGTSNDVTTCECCGKANLKKTLVLETRDEGIVYYGIDCAARAINPHNSTATKKRLAQDVANIDLVNRALLLGSVALAYEWLCTRGYQCRVKNGRLLFPIAGQEQAFG